MLPSCFSTSILSSLFPGSKARFRTVRKCCVTDEESFQIWKSTLPWKLSMVCDWLIEVLSPSINSLNSNNNWAFWKELWIGKDITYLTDYLRLFYCYSCSFGPQIHTYREKYRPCLALHGAVVLVQVTVDSSGPFSDCTPTFCQNTFSHMDSLWSLAWGLLHYLHGLLETVAQSELNRRD